MWNPLDHHAHIIFINLPKHLENVWVKFTRLINVEKENHYINESKLCDLHKQRLETIVLD